MNYTQSIKTTLLSAALTLTVNATAQENMQAQNDQAGGDPQAFEIAARSDRSDRGFGDSEVELQMILRNAAGQESTRELKISTLELPDESTGDKSLVLFNTPRDIEGTALLSYARILEPDDH
jgi:hypothetical protein